VNSELKALVRGKKSEWQSEEKTDPVEEMFLKAECIGGRRSTTRTVAVLRARPVLGD
jgi:hypothetical protein